MTGGYEPGPPARPPGPPNGPPPGVPYTAPQPEPRSVSFYVAIFLALLLLISGGLNLVLLVVSAVGSARGLTGGYGSDEDGMYELVAVGGHADASRDVLLVPIEGAIAEASSPLIGAPGGTVSQVRRALRAAEREERIAAVLFDINSPGGGVTDSDEIYRLISEFRERNSDVPVLALLGDVAASGGYYIAAACEGIFARPTTITGSIGVIISQYQYGEALRELGIEVNTIVSDDTPYKDMLSPTRPMRPEEEAKVKAIVQQMYERFVDVVDAGRPELTRAAVQAAATGEIYSALRARELGLVDRIASIADAYGELAERIGSERVRVVEQRRIPTFFDALAGVKGAPAPLDAALAQLLRSTTGPRMLYLWQGGR